MQKLQAAGAVAAMGKFFASPYVLIVANRILIIGQLFGVSFSL
jgi:hypothetical protein